MPTHKARARLRWRGAETVAEIEKRLNRGEPTVVLLPPGLHHALSVRLRADHAAHGLDNVTLEGEGFDRLTRIRGLRELGALREPLKRAGMAVLVRTPPPQLCFVAPTTPRKRPAHHHWNRTAALAA
jgi:hypothetical protein